MLLELVFQQWRSVLGDLVVGFVKLLEIFVSDSCDLLFQSCDLSVFLDHLFECRFKMVTLDLFLGKLLSGFTAPKLSIFLPFLGFLYADCGSLVPPEHLPLLYVETLLEDSPLSTVHRCTYDLLSLPIEHHSIFKICHWITTAVLSGLLDDIW